MLLDRVATVVRIDTRAHGGPHRGAPNRDNGRANADRGTFRKVDMGHGEFLSSVVVAINRWPASAGHLLSVIHGAPISKTLSRLPKAFHRSRSQRCERGSSGVL
jgi:hypothetical protein